MAQLQYRRKNLPEHAALAQAQAQRDRLAADLVSAETAVADLELDQAKAESDLEPVRERLARNQKRIADGSIADPKALAGLVEEVEHLGHRISDLEDAELEVMEQLEQAGERCAEIRRRLDAVDAQIAELTAARDEKLAGLDAEADAKKAERAEIAPEIPADLNALYDKLRVGHGGVGAAELRQRRCSGCRLEVNAADLRVFAAAPVTEVLRCEECGRILVRTADSGL